MKLVVQIKLLPDAAQAAQLTADMQAFNAAADHAARAGFEAGVFSQPGIHKRCYRALRDTHGVSSQTAVLALYKAAECFARDRTVCPTFRPTGAATYDQRSFSFRGTDRISLLTLNGRAVMPYVVGNYFADKLKYLKGQADLICRQGQFYLYATADVPEQPTAAVSEFLGVDLGIANLATDSTGERHAGAEVERHRHRHQTARTTFQRRGTRSARRDGQLFRNHQLVSGSRAVFFDGGQVQQGNDHTRKIAPVRRSSMIQTTTVPARSGLRPQDESIGQREQPLASAAVGSSADVAFTPLWAGDIEYTADDDYEAIESFFGNAGR